MQMVNALRNTPNSMSMESLKECVDPNLMDLYPHDCLFKVYYLSRYLKCFDPCLKKLMASLENLTHARNTMAVKFQVLCIYHRKPTQITN